MHRQQLEKKPEKPFMMYLAFDDLQVFTSIQNEQMLVNLCFSHLSILTISPALSSLLSAATMSQMFLTDIPGTLASGREMEGPVSLPGGYHDDDDEEDETAVSLSLHLTWPC